MQQTEAAPSSERQEQVHSAVRTMFGRDSLYMALWAVQLGAAALFTPVNTRLLGATGFGRVAAATAIMQVVFATSGLALQAATQRHYEEDGEDAARRLVTVGLAASVLLPGLSFASGPLWSHWLGFGSFTGAAALAVVWGGLIAAANCSLGLIKSKDRLFGFGMVTMLQTVGGQCAALVLVLAVHRSPAMFLLGMVIGQAAAAVVAVVLAPPARLGRADLHLTKRALAYSLPLVPGALAAFVLSVSDRLILQADVGSDPVGRYQVAYNVGSLAMPLLGVLNTVWMPRLFALRERRIRAEVMTASRDSIVDVLLPVVVGLSVGAPVLLRLWVPPSYHPDSLLLVTTVVAASSIPYAAGLSHTRILLVAGKTWSVAWTLIVAGLFNIALNLILVPSWSVTGSAWATLASYGLQTVLLHREAVKVMRLHRPSRLAYLQMAAVSLTIFAFVYVPTTPLWLGLRAVLAAGCVAWLAGVGNAARRVGQRPA